MKEDKKRERLAALFGLEEHLPTEPTPSMAIVAANKSREAEAVLAYTESKKKFTHRPCKWCETTFAADRANVAYCSDLCRQKALAEIGIVWDPNKDPRERWDFKMVISDSGATQLTNENFSMEPLTVPPPALVVADLAIEVQSQKEQELQTLDEPSEFEILPTPIVYNL